MNIQSICLTNLYRQSQQLQSLFGSEVYFIEEKSHNILLQLQQEVETTERKIIL